MAFYTFLMLSFCTLSSSLRYRPALSLHSRAFLPTIAKFSYSNVNGINIASDQRRSSSALHGVPAILQCLPDNQWGLYAIIASSAAAALRLERTTAFGKSLSGPVTAMLISAILTNIGILPAEGSIHLSNLQLFVLKLATPLLLFGADLKKIFLETGVMLKAFLLGTFGTLLGSFLGMFLLQGSLSSIGLPGDSWKIASALTAKNIGGGLNFFAVADAVKVSPSALATGLAVDNLLGLLYFPLISWIGAPYDENDKNSEEEKKKMLVANEKNSGVDGDNSSITVSDNESCSTINDNTNSNIEKNMNKTEMIEEMNEVEKMTTSLAIAFTIASISDYLSKASGLSSVPISTLIITIIATIFPKKLEIFIPSGELLGKLFLLFFFASVGNASGTVMGTFAAKGAASLVLYECILYIVHLGVILGVGRKVLNIPMPDLLLASNANIGNAATASSLATAKGWKNRILPAILVGTLGNTLGTFAGLSLGSFVLKKIAGF